MRAAQTQPIRPSDHERGVIRVPIVGEAKDGFPAVSSAIAVEPRGLHRSCGWDPRFGDDRERSDVIRFGREVAKLTTLGERLSIEIDNGVYRLR